MSVVSQQGHEHAGTRATRPRAPPGPACTPADFQERLRYFSLRKQLKQRAAAAVADADACTFRPNTGNAVQVLALSAARAGQVLETEQQRYERLAGEEAARLAAKRAAKEAEVYGGMEFKPQLNRRSLALAPAGSGGVQALAGPVADRQRARLEELRREEEARRRAECTFQVRPLGAAEQQAAAGAVLVWDGCGGPSIHPRHGPQPTPPLQPDTTKPRVRGYYDEYQPPQPSAALSLAAAAKQVRAGGARLCRALPQAVAASCCRRFSRAAAKSVCQAAAEL